MGEGLFDGRPDFKASGRQWRTPPLRGLGLAPVVNEHSLLLHDGRARNFEETALWHGGEAESAKGAYAALPKDARGALLAVLAPAGQATLGTFEFQSVTSPSASH